MLSIPINNTSIGSYLSGNGLLKILSDQDIWQTLVNGNSPFTSDVDSLAEVNVDLGANTNLKFGEPSADALKLDLSVSTETVGNIRLIWKSDDAILKKYKVEFTPNHYFGLLSFNSKADASIQGNANYFGGPLKLSFGIGAGGHINYERLVRFQQNELAKDVVVDIFKGIRLPQSVKTVADIPDEGEVLAFSYGGYLNLSAGLAWGYSLTGTKEIDIAKKLELSLDYAVRLMAAASFSYRIAGDFGMEVRCGEDASKVNIVVRKSKESKSKFALDFGARLDTQLKGLPATPNKLLEALLEIDTHSFIKVLDEIRSVSTVDGIKSRLNELAEDFVVSRAIKWLGQVLDDTNVANFLHVVNQIVEGYKNVDEKIIHLYEDFLDDIPGLLGILDRLIALPDRLGLGQLNQAADAAVWELIRRIAGDRFSEILLSDHEFNSFTDFVKEIKKFLTDGVKKQIREFIADLKKEFPLDALFNQLSQVDTVTKIKNLADKKLKGLIEKIVGDTIDANADVLNTVLKPLQAFSKNLDKFNKAYSDAIEKAVKQSFSFNLNYVYNSIEKGEELLDVEIDLSSVQGREMAESALHGDFTKVLQTFDPNIVKLNKAFFNKEITKSAELKINILNFNKSGIVRLVQNSNQSVEALANGLLYLYSIDTHQETIDETSWRKNKEKFKTNFALKIIGDSSQPIGTAIDSDVVQNLRQISAQYGSSYEDSKTKVRELGQYLELAKLLGLISETDAAQIVNNLTNQVGETIGKVKLEYVVKYSDEAIRQAFTPPLPPDFEAKLRFIIRRINAAPAMGRPLIDVVVRLAYLEPQWHQAYLVHNNSLSNVIVRATAPPWHRDAGKSTQLNSTHKSSLEYFYRKENTFVEKFSKLIGTVSSFPNVDLDDLEDAARGFVSLSDDLLVKNADNPFFALFDWFVKTKSSVPDQRKSALVLSVKTTLKDGITPFEPTLYFTG